jgi:drug/metabolite transporter (DMT)-like permease
MAVLDMSAMIYAGVFSTLLLNEKYHLSDLIGGLCTLTGVIFIVKPPIIFQYFGVDASLNFHQRYPGYICGIITAICFALNRPFMKIIKQKYQVSIYTMTQWVAFVMTISSSVICIIESVQVNPTYIEWFYMVLVGFCTLSVQILYCKAFTLGNIGTVSACDNVVFFALMADIFVFNYFPDNLAIFGSIVVVFSCLYIVFASKGK